MTVLIVGDEPDTLASMREFLRSGLAPRSPHRVQGGNPSEETLEEFDLLLDAAQAGTIGALIVESLRGLNRPPFYAENLVIKFERANLHR